MNIQQANHVNKLISDANFKLVRLQMNGIIEPELDIVFYMDTFRRDNKLIPYLTFRNNENIMKWNNIYMKFRLYFPESLSNQIYLQNNIIKPK